MGLCVSTVIGKALATPDYYYFTNSNESTSIDGTDSPGSTGILTSTTTKQVTNKQNSGLKFFISEVTILFFQIVALILNIY